jgi:hypothetical protein
MVRGRERVQGAKHLHVAIDRTLLATQLREDMSKFEVISGRVKHDGHMGRRFVPALQRLTLTRVLVAARSISAGGRPRVRSM